MKIKSITVNQLEGRPYSVSADSQEKAIEKVSEMILKSDFYKTNYTIEFEDGMLFEGSTVLHPKLSPSPVVWCIERLLWLRKSGFAHLDTKEEAIHLLEKYFPHAA